MLLLLLLRGLSSVLCHRVSLSRHPGLELRPIYYFTVFPGPFNTSSLRFLRTHSLTPVHWADENSPESAFLPVSSSTKWMCEHVVEEGRSGTAVFSVWMSCMSMHLPVCVCLCVSCASISTRSSTERQGLCYHCNELGICWPPALSAQSTGRLSCRGSCPLLPHPLTNSAPSDRLKL